MDNLSGYLGLDGAKSPEDLGINANFGFRGALNWGLPLLEQWGLGVQLGSSVNYEETAVRVLRGITGTRDHLQNFTTVGLFQRTDFGLRWGAVYDFLSERYYQGIDLAQWRGQVGYAVGANDEVGLWGTLRARVENGSAGTQSFILRPIDQFNLYWRHIWGSATVTSMWVGLADEHGRFVFVSPGEPPIHHPFVFGAEVQVPLNNYLALYGQANFITPNDTGTVTATFGFAFYPGGKAGLAARSRFAPFLPLANNPTFAVDLQQ
jgi:hypothetical protein